MEKLRRMPAWFVCKEKKILPFWLLVRLDFRIKKSVNKVFSASLYGGGEVLKVISIGWYYQKHRTGVW